MTVDNVREFGRIVENTPEIQKRLEATTDPESLMNLVVDLGSQNGFTFTPEDVLKYYTKAKGEAQMQVAAKRAAKRIDASVGMPTGINDHCSGLQYLARQICLQAKAVNEKQL